MLQGSAQERPEIPFLFFSSSSRRARFAFWAIFGLPPVVGARRPGTAFSVRTRVLYAYVCTRTDASINAVAVLTGVTLEGVIYFGG